MLGSEFRQMRLQIILGFRSTFFFPAVFEITSLFIPVLIPDYLFLVISSDVKGNYGMCCILSDNMQEHIKLCYF